MFYACMAYDGKGIPHCDFDFDFQFAHFCSISLRGRKACLFWCSALSLIWENSGCFLGDLAPTEKREIYHLMFVLAFCSLCVDLFSGCLGWDGCLGVEWFGRGAMPISSLINSFVGWYPFDARRWLLGYILVAAREVDGLFAGRGLGWVVELGE